ncbi:GNAT family N-acetyltransferase [Listeria fleischmannii]|uniref:GNAT family N-acetyltransferase n=1 Tax=Listeria fleischmannii TaxID=1069827 RepID=UPI001629ED66|nr:GNAT family N-acetyltransferase [Listeria fleischmannii]MBC1418790.1 GNAT family N-acetyltransferase [Listeria fleischmannii]
MIVNLFHALPKIISTKRLTMVRTTLAHSPALFKIWSDSEVAEYMNIEKFTTVLQAEEMIKAINAEPAACRYTIFLNKEIIGSLGINEINSLDNTIEIGYELAKPFWKKGYMTELLTGFLSEIESSLPYKGVFAKVLPDNSASILLLEKLGFQLENQTEELDLYTKKVCTIFIYKLYFK